MKPAGAGITWAFFVALYYRLQERRWRRKLGRRKSRWMMAEQQLWRYQACANEALERYVKKVVE